VISLSLLEIVASFWYPTPDVPDIVQYISFLSVVILLIHERKQLDYAQGVQMYLYGVILLCGVIVIATLQDAPDNWFELFTRGAFRFGGLEKNEISGMALSQNANGLAYYSITGITCGIFMAERRKSSARVWYIILAVLAAVAGFFTVTRSWVLVVALLLLVYILSKLRTPKQFLALAGVLALLTVTCVIIVNNNPRLLDGFIARFTEDDVESGNNRVGIFWRYMELYFKNPRYILFGAGVTQYHEVLQTTGSLHNGTQQILVCTGIVGFILYMFALIGPVLQARKMVKGNFAAWLPLLGLVAFAQFIPFLNPMMLLLPYIIGVYALKAEGQMLENRIGKET
jgi:O-antigen ligase